MKTYPAYIPSALGRQQGAAVLVVVVVLAFVMGLMALTVSAPAVNEQRISGNDLRAREVHEAAEAGLAFAKAWAGETSFIKPDMDCSGDLPKDDPKYLLCSFSCPAASGSEDTRCPDSIPSLSTSTSGNSYTLGLTFNLDAANNIRVESRATGADGSAASVVGSVEQIRLFNDTELPPPIVVSGSLSVNNGNPVIDTGTPPSPAILINSNVAALEDISTGSFNKKNKDPSLGAVISAAFPATSRPAWDYVFAVDLNQAIAKAVGDGYEATKSNTPAYQQVSGKGPFYVWNSSDHIHGTYGSFDNPIVLIVPEECPKINGNTYIYGIVYFGNPDCADKHGWGNAHIYGSIVVEGDIDKMTANAEHSKLNNTAEEEWVNHIDYSTSIPGTWKDF